MRKMAPREARGYLWDERTSEEDKQHIQDAIDNARPIPGVPGWVTGSWQGSVRPTFGQYKGHSMDPGSKLAEILGFPKMSDFQLFYLMNPINIPHE